MATIMKLKSKLKLAFDDPNEPLRTSTKTSFKRPGAKLQKKDWNASFYDIPEELTDELPPPEILPPPKPFRRGHSLRPDPTDSSESVFPELSPQFSFPYDDLEPDFAPTFTRKATHQGELFPQPQESTRLSKIFGRRRSKRPQPVDNFTKWDSDRPCPHQPYDLGTSGVDSVLASAIFGIGAVAAGPSNPQQQRASTENNPFNEAIRVRRSWAARRDSVEELSDSDSDEHSGDISMPRSKQKQKRQAICDIDWSDYADGEAIQQLIRSYDEVGDYGRNNISPVDSGIGLIEDDELQAEKGKSRVVETGSEQLDAESNEMDRILAMQMELDHEMAKQQRIWSDRMETLRIQQEEELDRERQKEEDRQAAIILERELRLERERQEEADRIAAEKLEREERLECERQEEEDRLRAEELVREEEARIAAELLKPRECVCCSDDKESSAFPAHPPTYTCEHTSQTCQECMVSWISSELESKGCSDFKCPECPEVLSYDDVHRAASEETFLAYEKLLTRTLLGSLPEFSWCLNPAGCENGQENPGNNNFMECGVCQYKQCVQCQCAWHKGETCEQYEYRTSGQKSRDEEAATQEMIDSVSKKCPGTNCGWRIEKIDGCDHMTCKKCKWEFCWECLASHKEIKRVGNTAHLERCKFHSNNLATSWPFNMH